MNQETKANDSFLIKNINGWISTSYCSYGDSKGRGIMLFAREGIPSDLLAIENKPIESLLVELNLRNDKCLINHS